MVVKNESGDAKNTGGVPFLGVTSNSGGAGTLSPGEQVMLTVDTDAMDTVARDMKNIGDSVVWSKNAYDFLLDYKPTLHNSTDSSWTQFADGYDQISTQFFDFMDTLCKAVPALADSLKHYADLCRNVEENNAAVARGALTFSQPQGVNGPPAAKSVPRHKPESLHKPCVVSDATAHPVPDLAGAVKGLEHGQLAKRAAPTRIEHHVHPGSSKLESTGVVPKSGRIEDRAHPGSSKLESTGVAPKSGRIEGHVHPGSSKLKSTGVAPNPVSLGPGPVRHVEIIQGQDLNPTVSDPGSDSFPLL